jgi:hypothetical protein
VLQNNCWENSRCSARSGSPIDELKPLAMNEMWNFIGGKKYGSWKKAS